MEILNARFYREHSEKGNISCLMPEGNGQAGARHPHSNPEDRSSQPRHTDGPQQASKSCEAKVHKVSPKLDSRRLGKCRLAWRVTFPAVTFGRWGQSLVFRTLTGSICPALWRRSRLLVLLVVKRGRAMMLVGGMFSFCPHLVLNAEQFTHHVLPECCCRSRSPRRNNILSPWHLLLAVRVKEL